MIVSKSFSILIGLRVVSVVDKYPNIVSTRNRGKSFKLSRGSELKIYSNGQGFDNFNSNDVFPMKSCKPLDRPTLQNPNRSFNLLTTS